MTLSPPIRHDIIVQSSEGQFVAVVEINNRENLTHDLATILRHNSMLYSLLPQTPYYLLLSQDRGFLWKDSWREGPEVPPTYEFPMDRVMSQYSIREPGERLYNASFEFLVLQWLNDLSNGKRDASEEPEKTLAQAGLYELIKEGTVTLGVEE